MTTHQPKRPSLTIGFGALMLQSLTTPFVIAGALRTPPAQPQWLTGLFLALDFASLATLAILGFGMRTKRDAARFAPAVLVLPCWIVVAAVSPVQQSGVSALLYSLFALAMGAVCAAPFLTSHALHLFQGERHVATNSVSRALPS